MKANSGALIGFLSVILIAIVLYVIGASDLKNYEEKETEKIAISEIEKDSENNVYIVSYEVEGEKFPSTIKINANEFEVEQKESQEDYEYLVKYEKFYENSITSFMQKNFSILHFNETKERYELYLK